MSERERFEQYMRDRYGDISLDIDDVYEWYAEIAVRFAWAAWQARATLAEQREAELVRLLKRYRHETPLGHQPHMIAAEVDGILATHESQNARSGGKGNCEK